MKSRRHQSGFTLVELVVVIVILGILAAVAIPKFVSLQADARQAKLNAAVGAMKAASAMVHAQWLAQGSTASSLTIEGVSVAITNGYPSADNIAAAAGIVNGQDGYTVSAGVVGVSGAATAANCQVTYAAPGSANSAPTFTLSTTLDCS